jgi:hypothetical protein
MTRMAGSRLALLLGLCLLTGCGAPRPAWLQEEEDACYRARSFTQEVPRIYWGDPSRDPCWRFRTSMPDR